MFIVKVNGRIRLDKDYRAIRIYKTVEAARRNNDHYENVEVYEIINESDGIRMEAV